MLGTMPPPKKVMLMCWATAQTNNSTVSTAAYTIQQARGRHLHGSILQRAAATLPKAVPRASRLFSPQSPRRPHTSKNSRKHHIIATAHCTDKTASVSLNQASQLAQRPHNSLLRSYAGQSRRGSNRGATLQRRLATGGPRRARARRAAAHPRRSANLKLPKKRARV